jgi:hypothetical protein
MYPQNGSSCSSVADRHLYLKSRSGTGAPRSGSGHITVRLVPPLLSMQPHCAMQAVLQVASYL